MSTDKTYDVLCEIRNWIRASSYGSVKSALENALSDARLRTAYQMMDGSKSQDQVRTACKISPNTLVALCQKCESLGLMESTQDKKRRRLFDLRDFDLLDK